MKPKSGASASCFSWLQMVPSEVLKSLAVYPAGFHNMLICTSCHSSKPVGNVIIIVRIMPWMLEVFIYLDLFIYHPGLEEVVDNWVTLEWCAPSSKCLRNVNYHSAGKNKRENTNGKWREGKSLGSRLGNYVQERFKRREAFTFICEPRRREVTQGGHVW